MSVVAWIYLRTGTTRSRSVGSSGSGFRAALGALRWAVGEVRSRAGYANTLDQAATSPRLIWTPVSLSELSLPNLEVLRHDVRRDDFPEGSFELVHARAVLMHLPERMATLRRMVSWLAPGGWLLVEEMDFGPWMDDFDPIWSSHPRAWHEAFPDGSLSRGRAMLRQIHQLGLTHIGADGELDIARAETPLAEFYRLSVAAMAEPLIASGVMTASELAALQARVSEPDFLACGFAYIGTWGRRPGRQCLPAIDPRTA